MRTRRPQSRTLTLPLAVLSAAFMLGCQDPGLEPVGPEGLGILLDKPSGNPPMHDHDGDGGGDATFTATWIAPSVLPLCLADVCGDPITTLHEGNKFLGGVGVPNVYELDLSFLQTAVSSGATCFAAGTFTGVIQLHRLAGKDLNARVLFSFPALGDDATDVDYALVLLGVALDDFLLPAERGDEIVIDWQNFDVDHENGPNRSAACSGTGDPDSSMLLTNTTPIP